VPRGLSPAHGAAQAQGRGALRVHRSGEEEPVVPAVREAVAGLRARGARARALARGRAGNPRAPRAGARVIGMVLAAGLGTRLRPLTERTAKPALPLLGGTLLGAALELLARAGIREVVVNASWRAGTVAVAARAEARRLGLALHLSVEQPEPLGTGGALVAARPLLDRGEPFVLLNGDVLADLDVAAAVRAHAESGAATTMVLR